MGVADAGSPAYPFLAPEIALLRGLLARDAPVLGICLGSQLLAAAAGARVYPNTRPGPDGAAGRRARGRLGPGRSSSAPTASRRWRACPRGRLVLHWHGDTFDLPPRRRAPGVDAGLPPPGLPARARARSACSSTASCERETVAVWVREDADYVRGALGPEGGARILADTDRHYADARPIWDRLLGNIISVMQ